MKRLAFLLVPAIAAAVPLASAQAKPTSADATVRTICHRSGPATRPYVKLRVSAAQQRRHLRHAADIIPAPRGACPRTILSRASGGTAFNVALTGEVEQPAGDPVGTGEATVRMRRNQGQVCFSLDVDNITLPAAAAHIHLGAEGSSGGIVVTLRTPSAEGVAGGCVTAARGVVNRILANPANYYVNVHTSDFPGGAVRGQLTGTSTDQFGWIRTVQMNAAQECNAAGVCNLGDPDGTGTAVVRIRGLNVCFKLNVQNIQLPSVGAHIHRAPAGRAGGIVVQFTAPDANGVSSGCTTATQALVDEIMANPANFYVNVHTRDFPGGAVRGQLN